MRYILIAVLILQSLLFTSCALYRTSPKHEFKDEFYTVKQRQEHTPFMYIILAILLSYVPFQKQYNL